MKLEIEVDEEIIRETVRDVFRAAFSAPRYDSKDQGSPGYEAIRRQVQKYTAEMDLSGYVQEAAQKAAEAVVRDVVAEELRKLAKAEVKRQRDNGELFNRLPKGKP